MSWEHQKENIQPLPQGRKIDDLMRALTIVPDNRRREMIDNRKRQFDEDCEQNKDDLSKQLDLWVDYIGWLEQNVPDGGKVTGLTDALEQCIETYYGRNEFKQDERLFDMFMKFKRFCDEPAEIFTFMYTNSIATLLARFYLNWSWQYEIMKNMKRAQDLIRLGLKNLATPRDVLEEALCQIQFRLDRMIRSGELDDVPDASSAGSRNRELQAELANGGIRAALQTLKFRVTKKEGLKVPINRTGIAVDSVNVGGLKSQTKVVNGVRVAKKVVPVANKHRPKSNRPVEIFNTVKECDETPSADENNDENVTDENAYGPMGMIKKMTTAQPVRLVGRRGAENIAPSRGVLATKHKPPVLLD